MKDLIIIGAGDMGRETAWIVEGINEAAPEWNILGFVDDAEEIQDTMVDGLYPVLGKVGDLAKYTGEVYVVCSVGKPNTRKAIMERVLQQENLRPATLIHPTAIIGRGAKIGRGSIIAQRCLVAIGAELGEFVFLNTTVSVGHDVVIEDHCSVMFGSGLAGRVRVGTGTEIGTGVRVIPGIHICPNCLIGAGAVVVRDITEPGTYVGVPVKKVMKQAGHNT